jgi:ribosome-associated protein
MEANTFELRGEFIELCNLLKLAGIANSGGQGKLMVSDGIVKVDGQVETRRTAKIRAGQIVDCLGQSIQVVAR